jgi:hypothetical protein
MKGVVFTEFLDLVEKKFSPDMADKIIDESNLPSKGVYTSVGTYPHTEMTTLVIALSKRTGIKVPDLLKTYGHYLFSRFHEGYPEFFRAAQDSFGFLHAVEDVVHVEVRKLYPDAELPSFETVVISPDRIQMTYRSPRCLGDFAEGLMRGCFEHYNENVDLVRTDEHDGKVVRFDLTKRPL